MDEALRVLLARLTRKLLAGLRSRKRRQLLGCDFEVLFALLDEVLLAGEPLLLEGSLVVFLKLLEQHVILL